MATKTIPLIMFPFSGYKDQSERQKNFWELIEICKNTIPNCPKPVIIVSKDTEVMNQGKNYKAFENDIASTKYPNLDIQIVWSVDTCQRWLSGWGYILSKYDSLDRIDRIALLPGDIDNISDKQEFFNRISDFLTIDRWPIIIGDFKTSQKYSSKDLVDLFGTIPLMANWFPDIMREIQDIPLQKLRSEFLNIQVAVLKELILNYRVFAYEQTLNMLIRSWDFKNNKWEFQPHSINLGYLEDDKKFRTYLGCLDQIERTERMLKLVWREIYDPQTNKPNYSSIKYKDEKDFSNQYEILDRHSTSIRDNFRVTVKALVSRN